MLEFNYSVIIVFVRVNFFSAISTFPRTIPIHNAAAIRAVLENFLSGIVF